MPIVLVRGVLRAAGPAVAGRSLTSSFVYSPGGAHAVVHNAGITRDRSLRRMKPDQFADVINVRGMPPMCGLDAPLMLFANSMLCDRSGKLDGGIGAHLCVRRVKFPDQRCASGVVVLNQRHPSVEQ